MKVNTQNRGEPLSTMARAVLEARVEEGLSPYADSITRISMWLSDDNGPRGGIDQWCRIQVSMAPRVILFGEAKEATLELAVQVALRRVARRVKETLERRREHDSRRVADVHETEIEREDP